MGIIFCEDRNMGKAKKRILHKSNTFINMTRENALNEVFSLIKNSNRKDDILALDLITLFGLSPEELLETGVPYENIKALENLID